MAVDLEPLHRKDRSPFAQIRWHLNQWITRHPWILNALGCRLTVFDAFQAPGDTLLTAIVCRHLHQRYPRLRLNCLTLNPDLLTHDPNLAEVNAPESYFSFLHWYPDIVESKDGKINVLKPTFDRLGFQEYDYRARVYLSEEERSRARALVEGLARPIVTINIASKELVKTWPMGHWQELLPQLKEIATVVQLGDDREPQVEGVTRLAGTLSRRESMAVLSCASLHIGPDSFLMHAANGLDVPSVILFGGSRTPLNLGYKDNTNLYTQIECSPCWIHDSQGGRCLHDVKCMAMISSQTVFESITERLIW